MTHEPPLPLPRSVRRLGPSGRPCRDILPVDTCVDAIADYMRSPAPPTSVASSRPAGPATRWSTGRESGWRSSGERPAGRGRLRAQHDEPHVLVHAGPRADREPGDRIVCTQLDHDSNVSPWLLAARDAGATVEMLAGRSRRRHARRGAAQAALRRRPDALGRDLRRLEPYRSRSGHRPGHCDRARVRRPDPRRRGRAGAHLPTDVAAWDVDVLRHRRTSGTAPTRARWSCARTCCARSSPTACDPPTTTAPRAGRPGRPRSRCSPGSRPPPTSCSRPAWPTPPSARPACSASCRRVCTRCRG